MNLLNIERTGLIYWSILEHLFTTYCIQASHIQQ